MRFCMIIVIAMLGSLSIAMLGSLFIDIPPAFLPCCISHDFEE